MESPPNQRMNSNGILNELNDSEPFFKKEFYTPPSNFINRFPHSNGEKNNTPNKKIFEGMGDMKDVS